MHYLNQHLGLAGHLLPDMYDALTIGDFLENKSKIPLPSKLKMINPLVYLKTRNHVMIDFWNVGLRHPEDYWLQGIMIYDLNNELLIEFNVSPRDYRSLIRLARLEEGRYNRVRAYHSQRSDRLYLISVKRFGTSAPDFITREEDLEKRILGVQDAVPTQTS